MLGELPAQLIERLPGGAKVEPRLSMAARLRATGDRAADLRLRLLRVRAREERALSRERDSLEREIASLLEDIDTSLPRLFGLGPLGAADLLIEVGDPRRFRSADAFGSYTGTAPVRLRPRSLAVARSTIDSAATATDASTLFYTSWL